MQPLDPEHIKEQSARLRRLAVAIVGDNYADDVLQDVWVAALDGPRVDPARSEAWLSRVTRNLAWRRRIGDSRRQAREEQAARSEASETLEEIVARIEEGHVIERTLLELEEPYRSTLLWHYYDELPISEVSRHSGRPESTTRTHLQRGLERLRERLKSEHGPDWRMALLPWLRLKPAAPVGVGAASALVGGSLMMWFTKSVLVAAAALSAWAIFDRVSERDGLSVPPLESEVQESEELASLVTPSPADSEAQPEALREDVPPAKVPRTARVAAASISTPARVIDPVSRTAVPGLRVRVNRAGQQFDFVTDEEGLIELPFDTQEPAPHSPQPHRMRTEALIGGSREHVITLYQRELEDEAGLELILSGAWTAWVRMPLTFEVGELEQLSATSKLLLADDRVSAHPARYEPVSTRGNDALFVIPRARVMDSFSPRIQGRTLEMSIDAQRGLVVELPAELSLADDPYLAELLPLVTQEVLVRSSLTDDPVFGAFVSLRERGRPNSAPVELASGFSDKYGKLSLPSVRPGSLLAIVNRTGFELTFHDVEVFGGNSVLELDLTEPAGKSDLEVIVRLKQGPLPRMLAVTLFAGTPENIAGSKGLEPEPDGHGGWSASVDFEGLAPGKCRVLVNSDLPGLGTLEPYYIELPMERVQIELATPPAMLPLMLELPNDVRTADFWIEDHSRLRLVAGSASSGAELAKVIESRPARSWLVVSQGHVPIVGREDAWRRGKDRRGEEVFVLAPKFESGRGVVVRVTGGEGNVSGARLIDPETELLLATTDDRGFAVLRDIDSGDLVSVRALGFQKRELELGEGPLTRTYLRAIKKQ